MTTLGNSTLDDDNDDTSSGFQSVVEVILFTASISSVLSCGAVIISYIRFKELRSNAFQMVLNLAVADIGLAVSFLLRPWPNGAREGLLCTVQGVVQQYFELAGPLWTGIMSYLLYRIVIQRQTGVWTRQFPAFMLIAWGVPLVATMIPFIFLKRPYIPAHDDIVGAADVQWCWINRPEGADWDDSWFWVGMCTFFFPLWLIIAFNVYVTVSVACHASVMARSVFQMDNSDASLVGPLRRLVRRLVWYPLILILCQLPITVARLYPLIRLITGSHHGDDDDDGSGGDDRDSFYGTVIATRQYFFVIIALTASQGMFHSIAYGMTSSVLSAWGRDCQRTCGCAPSASCCSGEGSRDSRGSLLGQSREVSADHLL